MRQQIQTNFFREQCRICYQLGYVINLDEAIFYEHAFPVRLKNVDYVVFGSLKVTEINNLNTNGALNYLFPFKISSNL